LRQRSVLLVRSPYNLTERHPRLPHQPVHPHRLRSPQGGRYLHPRSRPHLVEARGWD
jgi:hypothetical protein